MKILSRTQTHRILSLADQTLFAIANFTLTITIARYHGENELAAFGIALSIGVILQAVFKNSYVIHLNLLDRRVFRFRRRKLLGEHFIATLPFILVLAGISLFYLSGGTPSLTGNIAVATLTCFAIYCHIDFERILFIKDNNYLVPLLCSAAYFAINLYIFLSHMALSFTQIMLVLFGFAMARYLVLAMTGRPDFRGGMRLLRSDLRRHSLGSVLGVIGYSGYAHVPIFALGAFSTPAQVAAYVAFRSALQPSQIIMRSMDVVDKNQFREAINSSEHPRQVLLYQVLSYGLISGAMSLIICLFSKDVVNILYHGKYYEHVEVLYIWAVIAIFFNMTQPIESAIVMKKILTKFNLARLAVGILTAIATVFIATPFGALGVATISMLAGLAVLSFGAIISLLALCTRQEGAGHMT